MVKKLPRSLPLVGLALFVLFSNVAMASGQGITDDWTSATDPETTINTVAAVSDYTPLLEEDLTSVALQLVAANEGVLEKPIEPQTVISSQVTQMTNTAIEEAQRSQKREGTIEYTAQPGDTLSKIAWNYGVKIVSLQYANNLNNVNALKIGQKIKIPAADISPQVIAKAQQKKKLAQTSRGVTVRERADEGYDGDSGGLIKPINDNGVSRRLSRGHTGVDFRADMGTPVWAAASGRVVEIGRGWDGGYGNAIKIDHGNGRMTLYAHLSSIAVGVGQVVDQGQTIGYAGSTGRSTGTHLHFELRINGRAVDPGV